jgi:uncharacterized protein (DUF302 family)
MTSPSYGYSKNLGKVDFDEAVARVTEALKGEGFGVLTEIDVKATMKKKMDVDFRKYKILGACNPPLAHRALTSELHIGLLLPCNVIAFEEDDSTVAISIANPLEMFKIVQNEDLAGMAGEVDKKLRRALDNV